MKIAVHNLAGKKVVDMELSDAVFGVPANDALTHQVYVAQYSNRRKVIAHAKGRAEVAGSGKKPWAQKGTGRARTGAARNPIWRGGGSIFGPTKNRNFKKNIPDKMKRKALLISLSDKVRSGDLIVIDDMKLKERKTKQFAAALKKLKIKGSLLIGIADLEREIVLYSRNIPKVDPISIKQLNVFDILNRKNLILSKESVKFLENKYSQK